MQLTNGGTTDTYAYSYSDDDELLAVTHDGGSPGTTLPFTSYTYYATGEMTLRDDNFGVNYYISCDYDGQVTQIQWGTSNTTSFVYDALGRRAKRTAGGTTDFHSMGDAPGNPAVLLEKQSGTTGVYTYGRA